MTTAPARRRLATMLTAITIVASLLAIPQPAVAQQTSAGRPVPGGWDVQPAPGTTVTAGTVSVSASAIAPSGVGTVRIVVDGEDQEVSESVRTDVAVRAGARAVVAPGQHFVTMTFTDGEGREHHRSWRFTAAEAVADRGAGTDRIETAARLARRDRELGAADAAVLARADDFADALAGVPLAHHVAGPLLLTSGDRLAPAARSALDDLVADGGTVHLLGGTAAMSEAVADGIRDLGLTVARYQGEDRFGTAAAVAAALPNTDHAVVASGISFPDALAVAAPAATRGWPVLLATADTLPDPTRDALQGRTGATIIGGTGVIGDAVADRVAEVVSDVGRISGAHRFETAVGVSRALVDDSDTVGLASGQDFADALVGALDAARVGAPLLLAARDHVPEDTAAEIAARAPGAVRLYGGVAALSASVESGALAATRGETAGLESVDPPAGTEIHSLDQFRLGFDNSLDLATADVSVWFDGRELHTTRTTGDFSDTIVLTVGQPPHDPPLYEPVPVRVTGTVRDVDGVWHHVDREYTFRKIAMSRNDAGDDVLALQQRLVELGYWLGSPDGTFGSLTVQAVMAFQKYERLPVTGTADAATQARLATAERPRGRSTGGYVVEIDKTRQVLMLVRDGVAQWTFNTSTGTEQPYNDGGHRGIADTPEGRFKVCYERDELRESDLGFLWRPKYFECGSGIAVHGSTSVPSYPASHGCVRVTYPAMDFIWANDLMPMGAGVYVYGRYPGT